MLLKDLFKVAFTTGAVLSATVIIVSLVLKLFAVSLLLAVKLITHPPLHATVIFWENLAVPKPPKLKLK